MSDLHAGEHGGAGVKLPGGHKLPVKLLVAGVGVVALLLILRARSSASSAATAAPSAGGSTLGAAEAAMLDQLQSDNASAIAAALAQIPAGAKGPTGPAGAKGPTGPAGAKGPTPAPPSTVHQPAPKPAGGGSGVHTPAGHFYTVKAGDTLSGIAGANKVSNWHALLNPKTDKSIAAHPNLIRPGQKVWIPGK